MTPTSKFPDHYPIANASWDEKLSWLAAEQPPFDRMREAIPWLYTDEQLGWWIDGLRDALAHPTQGEVLATLLCPALDHVDVPQ